MGSCHSCTRGIAIRRVAVTHVYGEDSSSKTGSCHSCTEENSSKMCCSYTVRCVAHRVQDD